MAKNTVDETSERKRISIPRADESVLAWWDEQNDPGLSVRLLIRGEIERNGYTDTAFRPVAQLARRGRPPVTLAEEHLAPQGAPADAGDAPVLTPAPVPARAPAPSPVPVSVSGPGQAQPAAAAGVPSIDDLMNG